MLENEKRIICKNEVKKKRKEDKSKENKKGEIGRRDDGTRESIAIVIATIPSTSYFNRHPPSFSLIFYDFLFLSLLHLS